MPPEAATVSANTGTRVLALTPQRQASWDAFVRAHPEGSFFHLSGWAEVLKKAFGHRVHYLVAERDGGVCGVLPLAEVRSLLFGHALVSTPFCVYGGIVAADPAAYSALQAHACTLAQQIGVSHLELRNRRRRHPDWPCKELYVTFRKPIAADAATNLKAIPNKQRAMIRKGARNGLVAEIDETTRRHYLAYSESLRNLGTPVFARRYLDILRQTFGRDCEILSVTHQGNVVCSVLSFYFRDEVLPYYGGGGQSARRLAANDFMYWEVMERARQRGCRLFDYGRSKKDSGSYHFKRYWGFEPEQLYYECFLVRASTMPDLSPMNPRYRAFIAAWRRLPLGLSRTIGPLIAGALG